MATRELQNILNSGEITSVYLGGTTSAKKVTKQEDVTAITTPLTARVTALEAHKSGFADYNDLATATTRITVPGTNTYVSITNDTLGPQTTRAYLPTGVTDIWNPTTGLFDFSQLSNGDTIDIRLSLEVTTTSPSQSIDIDMELGIGGFSYDVLFHSSTVKTAGTQQINRFNSIYMGDDNTRLNGARFKIRSDALATCKVLGWYCKIERR